jgi:c(7)-type cytochrome triheme protein
MTCHRAVKKNSPEIRWLAALGDEATPFPERQIYAVQDFVIFSHARHRKAGVECRNCHGAVSERDVITKEVPTTMKSCVDCHKARRAKSDCNTCHELGQ